MPAMTKATRQSSRVRTPLPRVSSGSPNAGWKRPKILIRVRHGKGGNADTQEQQSHRPGGGREVVRWQGGRPEFTWPEPFRHPQDGSEIQELTLQQAPE